MALRQLIITRNLTQLRSDLAAAESERTKINERREAWRVREQRAEAAFTELNENSSEEERAAFEAEANEVEEEDIAIRNDEEANETRQNDLRGKITELEEELEEINKRANKPTTTPSGNPQQSGTVVNTERGHANMSDIRSRVREIIANDEVRNFLGNVRSQNPTAQRGVTNVAYTIPTLMMPMVRESIDRNSKLLKHMNVTELQGDGIMNILAAIPEAVWTDTVGNINEINLSVSQLQTFGSKLGAYISIKNPHLEDSDEDLAVTIIEALGQSSGYGLDKAMVYGKGKGSNIPVGFVTRLAAETQPAWWQDKMPPFKDISKTHIGKLSGADVTGIALFKELIAVLGKATPTYNATSGSKFWAMKESTFMRLQSEFLSFNSAGAIVSGATMEMPVIGGKIELLDFIPDGDICGGHGSQYKVVKRRGIQMRRLNEIRALEDETVFMATSRWDGFPYSGEGFALFSLNSTGPKTSLEFAEDKANAAEG